MTAVGDLYIFYSLNYGIMQYVEVRENDLSKQLKNIITTILQASGRLTFDLEAHFEGAVVIVLGRDLAMVESTIRWSYVLNDEAPLVRSLIEVDAQARIGRERKQSDGQRMRFRMASPRDLRT